nr:sugar phosphate nucleotidyltransferase [Bacillota bacterium]
MKEPVLIIMAAGMGSRYGGLKQIDPVTDRGEIIMDFSLYDAMMAGFKKAIFVIKEEMKDDFYKLMENRSGKYLETEYAFQKLSDIPEGYKIPAGREKPWGTAHAVLSCRDKIEGSFAVINADDYYGPGAFHKVYDFLSSEKEETDGDFCMVGYELSKTLTENGHVARGVCDISKNDYLRHIVERKKIMRVEDDICYSEDDGKTWMALPQDATVSMNFWGYT